MRIIQCSNYLAQQENTHLAKAHATMNAPLTPPQGFWRRLWWRLSGGARRERMAHLAIAQEYYTEAMRYAQGNAGEKVLAAALQWRLDDRFILLRNYTPPPPWQSGGDIDGVLIGPHGVTVFEAKAWKGFFLCAQDTWYYRRSERMSWEIARGNPSAQAQRNVERLRRTIEGVGLRGIPIRAAVAVTSDTMKVQLQPPLQIPVLYALDPGARLDLLLGAQTLPDALYARLYAALEPGR